MRHSKGKDICHICGKGTKLTREHVPPQSAFNDNPMVLQNIKDYLYKKAGKTQLKDGFCVYTLCNECNNNTGRWYGKAFAEFCRKGMDVMDMEYRGKLSLCFEIYPLRVLKQVIAMFFSVNSPTFRNNNDELVKFILSREKKYLSSKYRIYMYFFAGNIAKWMGTQYKANLLSGKMIGISEIDYPPFGYVLTKDYVDSLFDITFFSRYDYYEKRVVEINLPICETNTPYPLDYRTKEEIEKNRNSQINNP